MKLKLSESSGKKTWMQFDGDDMNIVTEQQVDPIIEANKRLANDWRYGNLIGNTQRHQQKVAEIPSALYYDLVKKLGDPKHNLKAWKRWLNDPENRAFRTIGGTV
ncbi:MAG: hypothetical protein VW709_08145 [Rickettsiales bacterium]